MGPTVGIEATKRALRDELLAGRRARTGPDRTAARESVAQVLAGAVAGVRTVAAYVPLPSEPFPVELLARWHAAGRTVLLPVVTGAAPLDWVAYPSPIEAGALGIAEPTGPRLGPDALAAADVVLVPALAVDRRGFRLGRGGGHYDRSLALAPAVRRLAVLYAEELVDQVPVGPFDQPVQAAATPAGLRVFP